VKKKLKNTGFLHARDLILRHVFLKNCLDYHFTSGQIECIEPCPSGYLCTGPKPDRPNTADECPIGMYCPDEETSWYTIEPCKKGTYRSSTGADGEDDCDICPEGKFCPWGGVSEDMTVSTSFDCEEGFYCENENDGSWTARPYCNEQLEKSLFCEFGRLFGDICPIGTACPAQSSSFEENLCPVNRFCPYPGLSVSDVTSDSFYNCAAGYNCAGGARTSSPNDRFNTDEEEFGNICEEGSYCEAGSGEQSCVTGFYNPQTGLESIADCRDCPPGRICENGFETGNCAAGEYCYGAGLTENCDVGYKCEAGTVEPAPCNVGTIQTAARQSECDICSDGNFCDGVTNSAPGTYILEII
jgi:hypothetical protein